MNDIALLAGHPERFNRSTLYTLRTIVARYPWFETARILLLDNLYLLHDPEFAEELRASVLYVHDRRTLCRLIDTLSHSATDTAVSDTYSKEEVEPTVDRTMSLIDAFLSTLPDMSQTLIPDTPVSTDYMALLEQETDEASENVIIPEKPSVALRPTIRVVEEKIPEEKRFDTDENETETLLQESKESVPAIITLEVEKSSSSETSEEAVNPEFFTETLARIYIRQKKYDRALEIIRSLYLNYPEKNIYFADQIRFLEKLVKNNNLKNK